MSASSSAGNSSTSTAVRTVSAPGLTLLVDNYDSFTFNIFQYLAELGATVRVIRNDEKTLAQIIDMKPTRIVISPGPGSPDTSGVSKSVLRHFAGKVPILGVCLGHQAMVEEFGGEVVRAPAIMHGKVSNVQHDAKGLFAGLSSPLQATRYHSLCAESTSLPSDFEVSCWCDDTENASAAPALNFNESSSTNGVELHSSLPVTKNLKTIMGVRHKIFTMEGVQFHPESITTQYGHEMLRNFLTWTEATWDKQLQIKT